MQRVLLIAVVSMLVLSGAVGSVGAEIQNQSQDGEQAAEDTTTNDCDYTDLYAESVDAVVQIQVFDISDPAESGLGSGFVLETEQETTETYIVTNQHVVADQETVTVGFSGGQSIEGTVVGTDVDSDLAVVAVDDPPADIDSLPLADELPQPGDRVAAVGSPFGLEGTITEGIVSAVDRSIPTLRGVSIPSVIQTDAPINPGNSGGPLLSCSGTVVGVNTAGAPQNLGFAVGTPLIEQVVPSLIETGDHEYAFLGVETFDVVPPLVEANDLERTNGVYVDGVIPESPAAGQLQGTTGSETVAGIPVPVGGDIIVGIDDTTIRNSEELNRYLSIETEPGEEVELTVIRDGEELTLTVTLGERPETESTRP